MPAPGEREEPLPKGPGEPGVGRAAQPARCSEPISHLLQTVPRAVQVEDHSGTLPGLPPLLEDNVCGAAAACWMRCVVPVPVPSCLSVPWVECARERALRGPG